MQIHNVERHLPQATHGCSRHADSDTQLTMRRKVLLEVASAAASTAGCEAQPSGALALQSTTVKLNSVTAVGVSASSNGATDAGTYDLTAMRRQKGSLSILTQDGDAVQIRFRTREELAVKSTVEAESVDGSASLTSIYAFASGRVQVAVEGELDTDELKAIGDLMDKVEELAKQFFDGDAQAAFSAASELGFDSGEIASFALRLSVKESVRASVVAAPSDLPAVAPATQSPGPASVPAVATPSSPSADPASASQAQESSPNPATPVAAAEDSAAAGSGGVVVDPLATLQQSLGDFLKQVVDGLASVGGGGRAEFSMRWKLQVMIAALETAPAANTDPTATGLATDSLRGVAGAVDSAV